MSIAEAGASFPNPEAMFSFTTAFSQAGILVSHLVGNVSRGNDRFNLAKLVALEGQSISFAFECFRWMRTTKEKEVQDRTFSEEEENELGKIIAERVRGFSQEQPIYIRSPKDASLLLFIWSHWGSKEETNQYLARTLDEDPRNSIELLKCYLLTSWGMESGLSHKGDFAREQYDSITKVVDADLIYSALYKIYGPELDSPKYHGDNSDRSLDERVGHQFAYIYHYVKSEEQKAANREGEDKGSKTEDNKVN